MKDKTEEGAITVKGIDRETLQRFKAACVLQGKTVQDVLPQLLREYADTVLKRT